MRFLNKILIRAADTSSEESDASWSSSSDSEAESSQTSRTLREPLSPNFDPEEDSRELENSIFVRPNFFYTELCVESENLISALTCSICLDLFGYV